MGGEITKPESTANRKVTACLQYLKHDILNPVPLFSVPVVLLSLIGTYIHNRPAYLALSITLVLIIVSFTVHELAKFIWFSKNGIFPVMELCKDAVAYRLKAPGLDHVPDRFLSRRYGHSLDKPGAPDAGQGPKALERADCSPERGHKPGTVAETRAGFLTRPRSISVEVERQFNIIFSRINIGVVIYGIDGKIIKVNPAMERIVGYSQKELHSRQFIDLIHPDDILNDDLPFTGMMSGRRDYYNIEKRLVDNNGRTIWARMVGNRIDKGEGSAPFILALIDDISDRKEVEKTKDAFIGMVSHELKNPLMAVISSLRMAKKEGQFPEVMNEFVSIASDGAEELWVILENMLEISRARAGRLTITPVSSDLSHLIGEVIPNIKKTLVHNFIIDIPEDLPPVVVDPAKIQLILRNLLDNAVKYSPKGGNVVVFAKQTGEEILVGIKDEGIGISKRDLLNIFQPFERVGTANTGGIGLGLSVCRVLVELHRGRIWMESEPGEGSTCYFTLPLSS